MAKPFYGLTPKLILSFLLMVFVTTGLTLGYTFQAAKEALMEGLQEELKTVAGIMATQVRGEDVLALKIGDEQTEQFQTLRWHLENMRSKTPDLRYAYIMRQQNDDLVFVVDDSYGVDSDAASIGDVYTSEDPNTAEQDRKEILNGLLSPAAGSELYTDQWGTFLSGYAPVLDANGKAVAILGVDMEASRVVQRLGFVRGSIFFVFGCAVLIASILVWWFSATLSRDVRTMQDMVKGLENKLTKGGESKPISVSTGLAKRNDEIGELSSTIERMEEEIRSRLGSSPLDKL